MIFKLKCSFNFSLQTYSLVKELKLIQCFCFIWKAALQSQTSLVILGIDPGTGKNFHSLRSAAVTD